MPAAQMPIWASGTQESTKSARPARNRVALLDNDSPAQPVFTADRDQPSAHCATVVDEAALNSTWSRLTGREHPHSFCEPPSASPQIVRWTPITLLSLQHGCHGSF